jgi:hypothetical protein
MWICQYEIHVQLVLLSLGPVHVALISVCQFGELAASGMGRRCLYELLPQV